MSAATDSATSAGWRMFKLALVVLACILAAPIALAFVLAGLSRESR